MGKGFENFSSGEENIDARLAPENLERIFNAYKTDEHLAAFLAYAISGKYNFKPLLTISDIENFYTTFPTPEMFTKNFNPGLFIDTLSRMDDRGRISKENQTRDFDKYTAYQRGLERFVELMYPGQM